MFLFITFGANYKRPAKMKTIQHLLFTLLFLSVFTSGAKAQQSCSFIIHVDGVNGIDNVTCGNENTPCATINYGTGRAVTEGYSTVRISAGNYQEIINLADGISLWGGFDAEWAVTGTTTITGGQDVNGEFYTVKAEAINTPTLLSDLELIAPDAFTFGKSSYGVHVYNSTGLKLQRVRIIGGNGANGTLGVNGTDATLAGVNGANGGDSDEFNTPCNDNDSGAGGGGAATPGYPSTAGGNGGRGGYMDSDCGGIPDLDATPGISGADAALFTVSSYGYRGGGGGTCSAGGNGNNGQTVHGAGGNGASTSAYILGQFWVANTGENGMTGENGTGGGGGGGSGGCDSGTDSYGAGGGGGGSGGIAAPAAGTGGMSGGNSAAVFLLSSTCSFVNCEIIRGNGGTGGTGGNGGAGTAGGTGGTGGAGVGTGAGGNGGAGGDGGNSGGGGGGAGGNAYGIFAENSTVNRSGIAFAGGTAGQNGTGGTGTPNAGTDGAAGSVQDIGGSVTDNEIVIDPQEDPCTELVTIDLQVLSFCAGDTTTVDYNAVGNYVIGNTFTAQLSDANGDFSSPVNIGTVTATTSGTITVVFPQNTPAGTGYRIRVVSSTPSLTGMENGTNIIINALPSVSANTTTPSVCTGNPVTLTGSGADTYSWNNGVADGVPFIPGAGMYYTVTGTDNTTGCTDIDSVLVTLIDLPDTTVIQNGIQLTAVLTGATYQWVDCGNNFAPIIGENAVSFTPSATGNYAVIVTQNNCSDTSSCYNIITVGINDISTDYTLAIYPNPSHGGRIEITGHDQVDATIDVFDITGKMIVSKYLPGKGKVRINIPGKGIFIVRALFSDGMTNTQKVVVY